MPRMLRMLMACVFLAAAPTSAASLLYSVGLDSTMSTPNGFYSISAAGTTTWLFDLGDGSLAFNGGVAYHSGSSQFYAVGNDSLGNSNLVSFSPSGGGTYTSIGSLGQGYLGGLAYNSSDGYLYGISNDVDGNSALNRISLSGAVTSLGSIGSGFYGGLTFNPSNGLLYGLSSDAWGAQREFWSVDPTSGITNPLFELGDGWSSFNGGVAFVPGEDLFYVISNGGAGSTLHTLTLTGTLTPVSGIGGGFWNAGLAAGADGGGAVPEPFTWQLIAAGLWAARVLKLRSRG